jgi:hypothetical protein
MTAITTPPCAHTLGPASTAACATLATLAVARPACTSVRAFSWPAGLAAFTATKPRKYVYTVCREFN